MENAYEIYAQISKVDASKSNYGSVPFPMKFLKSPPKCLLIMNKVSSMDLSEQQHMTGERHFKEP